MSGDALHEWMSVGGRLPGGLVLVTLIIVIGSRWNGERWADG